MTDHHDHISQPQSAFLSSAGEQRRAQMLPLLLDQMDRIHARRRVTRNTLALSAAAALIALVTFFVLPTPTHRAPTPGPIAIEKPADARIQIVRTDPALVESWIISGPEYLTGATRISTDPGPVAILLLDDAELIHTLRDIERPAALIRSAAGVRLTAAVTDVALGIRRDDSLPHG